MRTLDTFYGRSLKGLKISKDGSWRLMLDGDIIIANHDSKLKSPDIPKTKFGQVFFVVSILDEEKTQLVFRDEDGEEWRVVLNPSMYSIKVPQEDEVFPQRGVPPALVTPPHPDDRIAEGPTGDEEGEIE